MLLLRVTVPPSVMLRVLVASTGASLTGVKLPAGIVTVAGMGDTS